MALIYKITNPVGNIYVGQTIDYKIRKSLLGLKPVNSKIVLNTETGIFYMSITDATKTLPKGYGSKTLAEKLSGKRKNNTNFILV